MRVAALYDIHANPADPGVIAESLERQAEGV
jgi:hypothetical protein